MFFSVDVHGRRLPLPEETGSFRMPAFADAGEAAMTAAAFQAGGKEVIVEAGVFRTGFRHPVRIPAPQALKAPGRSSLRSPARRINEAVR